jgi:hypothetical protein
MKTGIFIGFIGLTFIVSCNRHFDEHLGKLLKLPHHLEIYNPYLAEIPDSTGHFIKKSKIYSLVNVSCPTCIPQLYDLDSINQKLKIQNKDAQVIAICRADDNFQLIKYFFESKKMVNIQIPLVLDFEDKFIELNATLLNIDDGMLVLTNEYNKILLTGNLKKDKRKFLELIPDK